MKLRIFVEPQQGATYDDILLAATLTERLGFDGFFRSDHFLHMGSSSGQPGPTDAWLTLAGLARETSRVRLGTLVTSATFRLPALLAVQVAQVDAMSGGRIEFGFGTGWYEAEHAAFGIPFPERRFDLFEEQLEILTGIWGTPDGATFSHSGAQYTLVDNPAVPKPTQRPLPVIIGGKGRRRTPALAATYASEFNIPFPASIDDVPELLANASEACERIGRDPATLTRSVALVAAIGSNDADFHRRAEAIGRNPADLRRASIAGTPDEARERLAALEALGVETVYLQLWDLRDHDLIELLASEVL
ncbi:MAG: LLM class F420-dependent oxidoreductase [Actinomycetota bacterium]|nr:LLM class F420-dependent oxidoreductase [Actinomycetota bacterium]